MTDERAFADPETAARKLVEIAAATPAVQDGRIYIERINAQFVALLKDSRGHLEFGAGINFAHRTRLALDVRKRHRCEADAAGPSSIGTVGTESSRRRWFRLASIRAGGSAPAYLRRNPSRGRHPSRFEATMKCTTCRRYRLCLREPS
ncbi:hypothetical protein [Bradyrhizobium sacchari]|uniref:hypothetical protein n=1 Tax=Bradyrhizobium sacchari TaxID=1399419 RepID=UPI001FD9B2AB|nr:hypothetical protein [Bradyrhizobium sacchari]